MKVALLLSLKDGGSDGAEPFPQPEAAKTSLGGAATAKEIKTSRLRQHIWDLQC